MGLDKIIFEQTFVGLPETVHTMSAPGETSPPPPPFGQAAVSAHSNLQAGKVDGTVAEVDWDDMDLDQDFISAACVELGFVDSDKLSDTERRAKIREYHKDTKRRNATYSEVVKKHKKNKK